jgi:hypothetical protein
MSLPHGFKAKANRIALGLRFQMGLAPEAAIDLVALAARLNLPLVALTSFGTELPDQVGQLVRRDVEAFSAVLLRVGPGRRIILFNDRHSLSRRNSSIAHEIAHALLAHPPTLPFDHTGCRVFDKDIEDEANCVGSHILVSNEAAWYIVRSGLSAREACDAYGVSRDMLEFRLNTSGARIRQRRWLDRMPAE